MSHQRIVGYFQTFVWAVTGAHCISTLQKLYHYNLPCVIFAPIFVMFYVIYYRIDFVISSDIQNKYVYIVVNISNCSEQEIGQF